MSAEFRYLISIYFSGGTEYLKNKSLWRSPMNCQTLQRAYRWAWKLLGQRYARFNSNSTYRQSVHQGRRYICWGLFTLKIVCNFKKIIRRNLQSFRTLDTAKDTASWFLWRKVKVMKRPSQSYWKLVARIKIKYSEKGTREI